MDSPPTVFDEILERLAPQRVLNDPRATGAGVAVAVVDSGIDRALLREKYGDEIEQIEGIVVRGTAIRADDGRASSPHGTTVADIILALAPKAKLFSADVFGTQGSCEVESIIAAMRHAMDVWQVKIINLSLGVPEAKLQHSPRRRELQRVVEEAYFRDVLVFAAAHNEHPFTLSYPAAFAPPLLSVDKALFDNPLGFAYRLRERIEFQAHGRGNLGPFAREPATSWAAPHLAGIAARLISLKPTLKPFELKTLLYWMSRSPDPPSKTD